MGDQGGGQRLEAGELGHESPGVVQLSPGVCEGWSPGGRKQRPEERSTCRVGPWMSDGKSFGWETLTLRGAQLEASVVESSLEASGEGLSALVASPRPPIVEEEGCQIHGVVVGFSLCASFGDGSIESKGEEKWA